MDDRRCVDDTSLSVCVRVRPKVISNEDTIDICPVGRVDKSASDLELPCRDLPFEFLANGRRELLGYYLFESE